MGVMGSRWHLWGWGGLIEVSGGVMGSEWNSSGLGGAWAGGVPMGLRGALMGPGHNLTSLSVSLLPFPPPLLCPPLYVPNFCAPLPRPPPAPVSPPHNITAERWGRWARLQWAPPPLGALQGELRGFRLRYRAPPQPQVGTPPPPPQNTHPSPQGPPSKISPPPKKKNTPLKGPPDLTPPHPTLPT